MGREREMGMYDMVGSDTLLCGKLEEKNVLNKEKKVKGQMNERSDDMIIISGCAEIYTVRCDLEYVLV